MKQGPCPVKIRKLTPEERAHDSHPGTRIDVYFSVKKLSLIGWTFDDHPVKYEPPDSRRGIHK